MFQRIIFFALFIFTFSLSVSSLLHASQFEIEQTRPIKKTLLVAEDEIINQMIIKRTLTNLGYEIVMTNNGKKATEALSRNPKKFTAVFTDVDMPVMNGIQLVKWIRNHENRNIRYMPILVCTANLSHKEDVENAKANAFTTKPIQKTEIEKKLREIIDFEESFIEKDGTPRSKEMKEIEEDLLTKIESSPRAIKEKTPLMEGIPPLDLTKVRRSITFSLPLRTRH